MIRWWFTLGYCTLLLLGCYAIMVRQVPPFPLAYRATHRLEAGHLLQRGDLQPVGASNRYLTETVEQGHTVRLDTASGLPQIRARAGRLTIAMATPADTVTSGVANAGANIFLCASAHNDAAGPYTVQSAVCAEDEADCILLLDVAADHAAPLAATLAAGPLTISGAKCQAQ